MPILFEKGEKLTLLNLVEYSENGIISKRVLESQAGNITLFSFDKDQKLSEHTAPFDAFLEVLEGKTEVMVGGKPNILIAGNSIILPANIPHAVFALEKFKMLLVMIKKC